MRQHKRRLPRYGKQGLFSGVAYCSDCGSKLYFHTRAVHNKAKTETRYEGSYSCSKYRKGHQYQMPGDNDCCTCHFIREAVLEQLVLEELRELLSFVVKNEKRFVRLVTDKSRQEWVKDAAAKRRAAEKYRRRIAEIDTLIERLYTDNVSGKVTDERYAKLSTKLEEEQAGLIETLDNLEREITEQADQAEDVNRFLSTVRRYTEIEVLTPAIVHEFIKEIVIHEPEQARGNRRQKVEIVYHKIGRIDLQSWQNPEPQN